MPNSSALTISLLFLRILILLNWLLGAAILALLVATVVAATTVATSSARVPVPDGPVEQDKDTQEQQADGRKRR